MSTPPTTNGRSTAPGAGAAPPHSLEAEQAVLGAVLQSDRTHYAYIIEEGLRPEDFYRERHRTIFESMLALYAASEPIDVLTVTEHLRSRGKLDELGGPGEVDLLTAAAPSVGALRSYGQIVKDHALLRNLLGATYEIQAAVHGHDAAPREIVERAEKTILEVAHDDRQKDFRKVGDVLHAEITKWQALSAEGRSLTGTPSGFADLDAITGGFQKGNLIVIAARPSMGKCLRRGSLVYDPATGARRPIEDVVDAVDRGEHAFVVSVGPDLKQRVNRVSAAYRNGRQPVYRLTTRLGRRVEATANHPLLTIHGWRALADLAPGARVAVPRHLPRTRSDDVVPDHELVMLAALRAESPPRSGPGSTGTAMLSAGRGATANATSDVWWDEVASVEYVGEDETFDLTVPADHNFVAGDVVVHNSALVTNIAENVALDKERRRAVALFSLEMSEAELAQRFIASQASIKGDDLRKGRLKDESKWKRVLRVAADYDAAPLYVDDSSDLGILDLRAKARRLHQQAPDGLGLIIVDYLQLMRADARIESRVQQVGEISRGLKILARELEVPVIALSQLSRGVESRTDKRPMLSDLRESGNIEQDSDLVLFIYRDEYYFPETTERPGEAELIISKHRNGALGNVPLTFQNEYPRFLGMQWAA